MRIIISANAEQEQEIRKKNINQNAQMIFKNNFPEVYPGDEADAYYILDQSPEKINFENFGNKPVFINAVIETLSQLQLPKNINRINAWPGFLQRDLWEVVAENKKEVEDLFNNLGWKIIVVKDEPGLVSARVISMIINEAFFAFEEEVSTMEEIDQAMKSGTNYPFGPFEWVEKIGLENVFNLLNKLSEKDHRYLPCAALEKAIKNK